LRPRELRDALIRWSFRDITANALWWRGEISADQGKTWRRNVEFTARRIGAA